jgi:hypothetical protein
MLRNLVIAAGGLCLAGAALALLFGNVPGTLMLGIWGAILLLGTVYERFRYKPVAKAKPVNAVRTDEKFIDDDTGKPVTVYIDPATGERTYVNE